MYLGIDIHKQYAQVAVMDENGEIDREVRVGVVCERIEPFQISSVKPWKTDRQRCNGATTVSTPK